jgi:hypothetical protein
MSFPQSYPNEDVLLDVQASVYRPPGRGADWVPVAVPGRVIVTKHRQTGKGRIRVYNSNGTMCVDSPILENMVIRQREDDANSYVVGKLLSSYGGREKKNMYLFRFRGVKWHGNAFKEFFQLLKRGPLLDPTSVAVGDGDGVDNDDVEELIEEDVVPEEDDNRKPAARTVEELIEEDAVTEEEDEATEVEEDEATEEEEEEATEQEEEESGDEYFPESQAISSEWLGGK